MDKQTKRNLGASATGASTIWSVFEFIQSLPLAEAQKIAGYEMSPFFVQAFFSGVAVLSVNLMFFLTTPLWWPRIKPNFLRFHELHGEMTELFDELEFGLNSNQIELKKRYLIPKIKKLNVECPGLYAEYPVWRHFLMVIIPLAKEKDYKSAKEITLPEEGRA